MTSGDPRPFSPAREDPRDLRRRMVGRDDLLDHLVETFRAATVGRRREHCLLIGPRGSGKSHLLAVAVAALLADPDLAGRYAVAQVPEDGLGVTRLADLLDAVLADLGGDLGAATGHRPAAVRNALGDRVLLLTVENLDRLLRNLGPTGRHDLRAWLRSSGALLLATTPTVPDSLREEDWSGTFTDLSLTDLDTDEAAELVSLLVGDRGDHATAEAVDGATGRARLAALARLTGGSPRALTLLAETLDPRSLDELTPAVAGLLERLVPHHQQILGELPPNEQRVVRALAGDRSASLTVGEISELADLGQAVTSTTLKRLTTSGVVASAKLRTGDRRPTWYHLRDPLLRHHVQERAGRTQPLQQVADVLRVLLDPRDRDPAADPPDADLLRELASVLDRAPAPQIQNPALHRDVDGLRALAHQWQAREDLTYLGTDLVELVDQAREGAGRGDPAEAVGALLRSADRSGLTPAEAVLLDLTALAWDADRDPGATRAGLARLAPAAGDTGLLRPLDTTIAALADEHTRRGAFDHARELHALLVELRGDHAGQLHPATLAARGDLAWSTALAGDVATGLLLHDQVVADAVDTLGAIEPTTLRLRRTQAVVRAWAGSPEQAAEEVATLVTDLQEVGPADHPDLLRARIWLALDHARDGRYADLARDLDQLLPEAVAAFGADAHTVHFLRSDRALARARSGDPEGAADDLAEVVADADRVGDPTGTLALHHRARLTAVTADAGDRTRALELLVALADDGSTSPALRDWCVRTVVALTDAPARAGDAAVLPGAASLFARVAAARSGDEEALLGLPPELAAALAHPSAD